MIVIWYITCTSCDHCGTVHRDRPAAIPVNVKHMADTSNFDDFEELDEQKKCKSSVAILWPFSPIMSRPAYKY